MTLIYILIGAAILYGIYRVTKVVYDQTDIKESEPNELYDFSEPVQASQSEKKEENFVTEEKNLNEIVNPDSEKPFAKISNTSPAETQILKEFQPEEKFVEIKETEIVNDQKIETKPVRKPRPTKSSSSDFPVGATASPKKKPYRKKRKLKTDENTEK